MKGGWVYLMTNVHHTTLYVGVTSNLNQRVIQHQTKKYPKSFTARYNLSKLVYFETYPSIQEAIAREKQIKGRSRQYKIELIQSVNPMWKDLFEEMTS